MNFAGIVRWLSLLANIEVFPSPQRSDLDSKFLEKGIQASRGRAFLCETKAGQNVVNIKLSSAIFIFQLASVCHSLEQKLITIVEKEA